MRNDKNEIIQAEKLDQMVEEAFKREVPLSRIPKIKLHCEKVNQLIISKKTEK